MTKIKSDRHSDNILLQRNGAVSHIDFDCIFEKGTVLPTPERVPFRLTPNIIDAFGVSGVEGTFRCTCEIAMRCMRENRDLVMSVLESLLYISFIMEKLDPLMDWKIFNTSGQENSGSLVFSTVLKVMENRLRGVYGEMMISPGNRRRGKQKEDMVNAGRHTELSVQGQVDNVIKDATDVYNLMRMYLGWMPFLYVCLLEILWK
ncbi:phosphatidylinositol kinase [Blastocystis sp. subtype 4]|uniref:phosphatidylinositol kinase n=1 Tax=Blastocystis sp. subtype 4 TaxID=944170 RepID=UPI00071179CC|nr:phosphatidylinositol kinase [Blastocystis sp. subtype 4]KNB43232.1 phosphatidylinositol kinase [Blastocystis sp. subtype 4]|eukprot:XP_014526671.1 phosphatidylinositol kinase [Blastocystis sp. subtype 4]